MNTKLKAFIDLSVMQRFAMFVGWVNLQPKDKAYDFMDTRDCAMCQFFKSLGIRHEYLSAGSEDIRVRDMTPYAVYKEIQKIQILPDSIERFGRHGSFYGLNLTNGTSKNYGELAAHLNKYLKIEEPPILKLELTDDEMERIESRPLVGIVAKAPNSVNTGLCKA